MLCRIFQVDFKECFHVCLRWRMDLAGSTGIVCCWHIKLPASWRVILVPIRVYNTRECSRMSHSLAPSRNSPVPNMTESLKQSVSPGRHLELQIHFCCWPHPTIPCHSKHPTFDDHSHQHLQNRVHLWLVWSWSAERPSDHESSQFSKSTFTKRRFLVFFTVCACKYVHMCMHTCWDWGTTLGVFPQVPSHLSFLK